VLGHHSNIVAELTGQEMFSERLCAHPHACMICGTCGYALLKHEVNAGHL